MSWLFHTAMSWSFMIAFAADCIGVLIALYFILSDFSRHGPFAASKGRSLSHVTLLLALWTGLCYYLYHHNGAGLATTMAWVPAFPMLGYGLIVALMVILKPDFR